MTLARTGRLLLLAAFLAAQQVALAHDVWHAAKPQSEQSQLCDFHDALGTVSGAVSGSAAPAVVVELQANDLLAAPAAIITQQDLPPASRGPPTLL